MASKPAQERFVLDCSVVCSWFFADEANAYADSVATRLRRAEAVVPAHWPLEVVNTIITGERRNRSTEAQATAFLHFLASLPIVTDHATAARAWSATLSLARDQRLTAYDAAYLELAQRRALPLATLDKPLRAAARALNIPLYTPHTSECPR